MYRFLNLSAGGLKGSPMDSAPFWVAMLVPNALPLSILTNWISGCARSSLSSVTSGSIGKNSYVRQQHLLMKCSFLTLVFQHARDRALLSAFVILQ